MNRGKNWLVLLVVLLAGVVIGGFVGDYASKLPFLSWLSYGSHFGMDEPFRLNLGIIVLVFGLQIRFTIAGVLGIVASVFLFKRM